MWNGAAFSCWKSTPMSQSGRQSATVRNSIQVANASLSHRSSHHCIVTRLPNHWWAISWATTSAMRFFAATDAVSRSHSSAVSRKKMAPEFSMAPASKSGTASRSSLP